MTENKKWLWWIVWLGVIGVALALRMLNLDFGLPQRLHPDEWSQVEVAWRMANGDWNPHFFRYPAGHVTLLAVVYRIGSLVHHPTLPELYLSARWVSVLLGVLGVGLAGLWAWRLWASRWAALTAALLSAFNWTWIEQSHYAVVDVPLLFWSGLALFALSESTRREGWLRWSAFALGFALAAKYTATLLVIPFLLSVWLEDGSTLPPSPSFRRRIVGGLAIAGVMGLCLFAGSLIWKDGILSWASSLTSDGHLEREYLQLYGQLTSLLGLAGVSLLVLAGAVQRWQNWNGWTRIFSGKPYLLLLLSFGVFIILSPFTLIEWRQSVQGFFYEYRHMQIGSAAHYAEGSNLFTQLKDSSLLPSLPAYLSLLISEWGLPALCLTCLGSVALVRLRRGFGIALLVYLALQLLTISSWANFAQRYVLMLHLPLAVLAGGGWMVCYHWLQKHQPRRAVPGALLLMILVLWLPVRSTFSGLAVFRLPDTREAAYEWAQANIPAGAYIAYDSYAPDFLAEPLPQRFLGTSGYVLSEYPSHELQEVGVEFVFTTFDPDSPDAFSFVPLENWRAFSSEYQLVKVFPSQSGQFRGRPIWVYQARQLQ